MRKYSIDTTLRVRIRHLPGALAKLAAAIGDTGGLLGQITIASFGENDTVRDVVVETADEAHTQRVIAAIGALDQVELLGVTDKVFERHKGGKIRTVSTVPLEDVVDLRYVYTPGVARVAKAIERDPELAWELTGIGNSVGIFTNGTRVLGLGNIGPLASLPVMEGKAVLYERFAGVSATPILVDTADPGEFVETVVRLSKSFGGIHLEDIRIPDCFAIERELKRRLAKPVMHDDQHGTATVALAAVINACRSIGVDPRSSKLGQIGLGAAGSAIARLALAYGVADVLVTDTSDVAIAALVADGARAATLEGLMAEADIVVAATGRPGLIRPADVRPGQVIFALSNPDAEIIPSDARAAGAAFAADGRTVNNALAFPGLFRAALTVRSRAITVEMLIAAAEALADHARPGDVTPNPLDPAVHEAVWTSVEARARSLGLAGTASFAIID
jgi:malate dehydrogenase (oxaloacetate-decarboxylating)